MLPKDNVPLFEDDFSDAEWRSSLLRIAYPANLRFASRIRMLFLRSKILSPLPIECRKAMVASHPKRSLLICQI